MPVIRIVQATSARYGTPDAKKVVTVSELGQGDRHSWRRQNGPVTMGGSPSTTLGPLTEQSQTGMIQVDANGVQMDDRDFANLSTSLRAQIASLMEKGVLAVDLDGLAQTATNVRTFT